MQGYRTVVLAILGLAFAVIQSLGIVVPQDEQSSIQVGIVSLVMLIMRLLTKTPVGGK